MKLHKDEERICRDFGNIESLSRTLANQSLILKKQGKLPEADTLIHEAYELSSSHWYTALAEQIKNLMRGFS